VSENADARQHELMEVGACVSQVGHALMGRRHLGTDVIGFSVRGPRTAEEDLLMTVRGIADDGTPMVTFLGGPNLAVIFVSLENMLRNGTLRWKPDSYRAG
jgi:hypothetical protein